MRFLWWEITFKRIERPSIQPLADLADESPKKRRYSKERHLVLGKQKMIILNLHTGPATETDLVKVLKWDRMAVSVTLATAVNRGFITFREMPTSPHEHESRARLNDHRLFFLTVKGIDAAKWFLAHPESDTLKGWRG